MDNRDDILEFRTTQVRGMRILLVEDNPDDEYTTKRVILRIMPDAVISCVKTISDAYEYCKKSSYDLILLDLNLPDGYGPNSVQEIRRFDKKSTLFVLTGLASDLTKQLAVEKGANMLFTKSQLKSPEFESAVRTIKCA